MVTLLRCQTPRKIRFPGICSAGSTRGPLSHPKMRSLGRERVCPQYKPARGGLLIVISFIFGCTRSWWGCQCCFFRGWLGAGCKPVPQWDTRGRPRCLPSAGPGFTQPGNCLWTRAEHRELVGKGIEQGLSPAQGLAKPRVPGRSSRARGCDVLFARQTPPKRRCAQRGPVLQGSWLRTCSSCWVWRCPRTCGKLGAAPLVPPQMLSWVWVPQGHPGEKKTHGLEKSRRALPGKKLTRTVPLLPAIPDEE